MLRYIKTIHWNFNGTVVNLSSFVIAGYFTSQAANLNFSTNFILEEGEFHESF